MKRFLQRLAEIVLVFIFMLCLCTQTVFAVDNESASRALSHTRMVLSLAITGTAIVAFGIFELINRMKKWWTNHMKRDKK